MQLRRALAVVLAVAAASSAVTVTLQQGLNGYTGCVDRELRNPSVNYYSKGPYTDRYWVIEF